MLFLFVRNLIWIGPYMVRVEDHAALVRYVIFLIFEMTRIIILFFEEKKNYNIVEDEVYELDLKFVWLKLVSIFNIWFVQVCAMY